jgi:hypothetical protein
MRLEKYEGGQQAPGIDGNESKGLRATEAIEGMKDLINMSKGSGTSEWSWKKTAGANAGKIVWWYFLPEIWAAKRAANQSSASRVQNFALWFAPRLQLWNFVYTTPRPDPKLSN